jgi:hypothetical protein
MTKQSSDAFYNREPQWPASKPLISTLTYRSRAASGLPPAGLEGLLARARLRNQSLGLTGMLLAAGDQFYHWLEGPPESVAEVWQDIKKDPRHEEIELIGHHHQSMRLFGDWAMRFVSSAPKLAETRNRSTARTLPPRLIRLMAELALKGDAAEIAEGLEELLLTGHDYLALHAALVEPAARLLGDWWLEDRIAAPEVTIALAYMQSAVRRIGAAEICGVNIGTAGLRILIAPQPGELHSLGACLVGDAFRRSGWRVTTEFPASVDALAACVSATPCDALILCLSDVFDRFEDIAPLAAAVRSARAASCNEAMVILAGGRVFQTQPDLMAFIGVDALALRAGCGYSPH